VEPATIDYGLELSPPVAAALPQLTAAIRDIVYRWRDKASNGIKARPASTISSRRVDEGRTGDEMRPASG
jgi:hypothetical protein